MINRFLLLVLIGIFSISIFGIRETQSSACDNQLFSCKASNLKEAFYDGYVVECGTGQLCNKFSQEVDGAKPGDKVCPSCMPARTVCKLQFKCELNNEFTSNGLKFKCEEGTICKDDFEKGCGPCFVIKCERGLWTCDPTNPSKFTQEHSSGICQGGTICNKEYTFPCQPCVNITGGSSTSVAPTQGTLPTSPTSPTRPTSLTTPITPSSPSSPTSSTVPSSPTSEATPSSPTSPSSNPSPSSDSSPATPSSSSSATTTSPPYKVPDCNDGFGLSRPCRAGPPGRGYYYKCKYYSPVWVDYDIKLCQYLNYDPKCQGQVCLS